MSTIETIGSARPQRTPSGTAGHGLRAIAVALRKTWAWAAHRHRVRRTRVQLAELSDEMLRDIGLTRSTAAREARRRFWDADSAPERSGE